MVDLLTHANIEFKNKLEAVKYLGKELINEKLVKGSFTEAVLEREKSLPTGLKTESINIAIPHTDVEHVNSSSIIVATLKTPITFSLMENPEEEAEVDIIFLIAVNDPSEQTILLRSLMTLLKDQQLLNSLKNASDNEALRELLDNSLMLELQKEGEK